MKIKCPHCGNPNTKESYRDQKDEDENDVRFVYECVKCGDIFIVSAKFTHCEHPSWEMDWNPITGLFEDV